MTVVYSWGVVQVSKRKKAVQPGTSKAGNSLGATVSVPGFLCFSLFRSFLLLTLPSSTLPFTLSLSVRLLSLPLVIPPPA